MSTSGKEDKAQLTEQLPKDQRIHDGQCNTESDSEMDYTESEEDDDKQMEDIQPNDVDTTRNPFQPIMLPEAHNRAHNSIKKARKAAMNEVHQKTLPEVLRHENWEKVYDKDLKSTYRALYFSTSVRRPNEDEITHNRQVGEIREKIREAVKRLQEKYGVNFKINSLLSKPILYDKQSTEEQSQKVAAFT